MPRPVIAAIPNYNMGPDLAELLPQLRNQNYADIFVLDDCSTDGSREVVDGFGDIHFITSEQNEGAGATRNKIIPALGYEAIIHFIDADTLPDTHDQPEVIRSLGVEACGFIGGLVRQLDGRQSPFNYGPRHSLNKVISGSAQALFAGLLACNDQKAAAFHHRYSKLLEDWPNPLVQPQGRPVFWSAEANLAIGSHLFESVGGFDPKLRQEEIQDLSIKLSRMGLERRFDPAFSVTHKATQVRSGNPALNIAKAELQLIKKYGIKNWIRPEGKFYPGL